MFGKEFKTMRHLILLIFGIFLFSGLQAQDLRYEPINPAFGGNTFNYQWLLSSAQAQNSFEDPNAVDPFNQDPLAEFQDNLNRQILSQLSRQLVSNIFGEDGELEEGQFEIGTFQIDITNTGDGVNVNIFDVVTGSSTGVLVPFF